MPNSQSKLATKINDQYFTPVETAVWCYEQVRQTTGWDFKGTALEPAVGGRAFVTGAESLKLPLKWTTNDLFPQPDVTPDFQEDFRTFDHGHYDYVITNPPFGTVNTLAKVFAKRGAQMADRVLMLLPRGAMRMAFLDNMPRDMKLVHQQVLEDETFITSTGEVKMVRACVMAWERVNQKFPTLKSQLDLRTDVIDWWPSNNDDWDSQKGPIDFQLARWGNMGHIFEPEKMKKSGARVSVRCTGISREDFVSIHEAVDLSDFIDKSNHPPAFDIPVWAHRFNTEAVKRGLLVPVE